MDGCDTAHEALMLKEYGEEVRCPELYPRRMPVGEGPVADVRLQLLTRERTRAPDVILHSVAEDVTVVEFLLATSFPKCP
jgi:hypothetical protein